MKYGMMLLTLAVLAGGCAMDTVSGAEADLRAPVDLTQEFQNPAIGVHPGSCGDATCTGGTVCCNASCGICAPPGAECTQQVCDPVQRAAPSDCGPQDATAVGFCRRAGYAFFSWNGSECVGNDGCRCEGPDCDEVFSSQSECEKYYFTCNIEPDGETCGDAICAAGTQCCNPSCGACVLPGSECTQEVCTPDT